MSDPDDGMAVRQAISLTAKPAAASAIACTLSARSIKGRLDEWRALLEHVDRRNAIDGGVRCEFAASVSQAELIRLVAAESACCQFFEFSITVDRRGVGLEVRAPHDALEIVESMFGAAA